MTNTRILTPRAILTCNDCGYQWMQAGPLHFKKHGTVKAPIRCANPDCRSRAWNRAGKGAAPPPGAPAKPPRRTRLRPRPLEEIAAKPETGTVNARRRKGIAA
jgi:hypothetical protein